MKSKRITWTAADDGRLVSACGRFAIESDGAWLGPGERTPLRAVRLVDVAAGVAIEFAALGAAKAAARNRANERRVLE
jgi:hypothetical protein